MKDDDYLEDEIYNNSGVDFVIGERPDEDLLFIADKYPEQFNAMMKELTQWVKQYGIQERKSQLDELRAEILTEFKQVHKLAPADYTENCTNVVMSLIRTEKLKLLEEVRERVISGDEPGVTNVMIAAEHAKQIKALTKLEAEL